MAKFLSSDKIKVFPTAFRGKDANDKVIDPNAFLTTEENIVNIANKVLYKGKNYFFSDGNIIHLILGGYYFVFNKNDILEQFTSGESDSVIWAGIIVNDLSQSYESYTTKTLTPNGGSVGEVLDVVSGSLQEFKGLSFVLNTDSAIEGFTYKLPLFKFTSSGWTIIEGSMLNLSTKQIADGTISEDGTNSSIDEEFTTKTIYTDKVELRGSFDAIYPKLSSNRCTVGTSSSQFNSGYFGTLYAGSIYDVSNISTNNLNVSASSAITFSTGAYTLQASSVFASVSSNIIMITSKAFEVYAMSKIAFSTLSELSVNASSVRMSLNGSFSATIDDCIDIDTGSNVEIKASGSAGITLSTPVGLFKVNTRQAIFNDIYTLSTTSDALHISNIASLGTRNLELHKFDNINIDSLNIDGSNDFKSVNISGLESISLNGYVVRPYEHRLVLTCRDLQLSHYAKIIANPKFAFSQVISTKSTLLTALDDASYYIGKTINNSSVTSPLVATGKLLWYDYDTHLYTAYNIIGIGAGTSNNTPILRCLCFKEGIEDDSAEVINIDAFTFDIQDLV